MQQIRYKDKKVEEWSAPTLLTNKGRMNKHINGSYGRPIHRQEN